MTTVAWGISQSATVPADPDYAITASHLSAHAPAMMKPASVPTTSLLFRDDFQRNVLGNDYLVVDDPQNTSGPSRWSVQNGELSQTSNIYSADGLVGTHLVAGSASWTDYTFTALITPTDNDGWGAIVRYQNASNYYRFFTVLDSGNGGPFMRLEKFIDGSPTTLAQIDSAYKVNQAYAVSVEAKGNLLTVWLDGAEVLSASDHSFAAGRVGLCTYACSVEIRHLSVRTGANLPPEVHWTSPATSAYFTAPAYVTLTATASDSDGIVTRVEYYDGSSRLGEFTSPPYLFTWTNVASGTHTVTAKAFDHLGGSATSAPLNLVVRPADTDPAITGQWDFDQGDLRATVGNDLAYFDEAAKTNTQFGSTRLFGLPDLNGQEARVMKVPELNPMGGYIMRPGVPANGGGLYINQYTLIMDLFYPESEAGQWKALLQTLPTNADDGDFFISASGGLGYGSYQGTMSFGVWHRIALAVDLTVSRVAKFIDGVKVGEQQLSSGRDGRWSLNPATDPLNYALLFADNNGENCEFYVNSIQYRNGRVPDETISALGGPSASGIRPADPKTNQLITVHLTLPANGAVFTAPANVVLIAEPGNSAGAVTNLTFYSGSIKLGEVFAPPYQMVWSNVAAGSYALTVKATNDQGAVAGSEPVIILVSNPGEGNPEAAQEIIAGRSLLAGRDLTNALQHFAAAVAARPEDPVANALCGATRVLALPQQPWAQDLMARLGVNPTNRNPYNWSLDLLTKTNDLPLVPPDFNLREAQELLRTRVLPEILSAQGNFAKVVNTNFLLTLSSNETTRAAISVDYADVTALNALAHLLEALGYDLLALNLDVPLLELREMAATGSEDFEQLLAKHPQLLTWDAPPDAVRGKAAMRRAIDLYLEASPRFKERDENTTYLVGEKVLDYDSLLASLLPSLRQSLDEVTPLGEAAGIKIHLGRLFEPTVSLRSLLPQFFRNSVVLGTLPDATLGGLVFGIGPVQWEQLMAAYVAMTPHLSGLQRGPNGTLALRVDSLNSRAYAIEVSSNLVQWMRLTLQSPQDGAITFQETLRVDSPRRFYRAQEVFNDAFSNRVALPSLPVTVYGQNTNATSEPGEPGYPQAKTVWWTWTALADGRIGFSAAGSSFGARLSIYTGADLSSLVRVAEKTGYDVGLEIEARAGETYHVAVGVDFKENWIGKAGDISLTVAPPPANDLFAQRIELVGTNATFQGHNLASSRENGEPELASYGNPGHSVWWTWTAPATGTVTLTADCDFIPGWAVYTGASLSTLKLVSSETSDELSFEAIQGTVYQIALFGLYDDFGPFTLNLAW